MNANPIRIARDPNTSLETLMSMVNHEDWMVRIAIAERGINLEQFASDPHELVRQEVQHQMEVSK
ncbi:hypothetical protein KNT64_gp034 [Pseudomonas phage PspYZU05]|uniref:Uncharacterized protein n=1 Tax=Pseudomonas phage PspYZU05 TaxID=1983556 RepID=A0A2U7N4Z4_9CAUD|nr:hypothetical protein KNT64_gp034 [Pseudomonas phage PspYZU05]ASD51986.1 hypothetical protein PspYZU05_34 [Pseudomonas phage PspYZU05]